MPAVRAEMVETMEGRIGILGGGNMAAAIVRGLLSAQRVTAAELCLTELRPDRRGELAAEFGVEVSDDNRETVRRSDVVLLAVKPQSVAALLAEVGGELGPDRLLISIAAGINTATLAAACAPGTRIVRAMPNTAAMVLAAATGLSRGPCATVADLGLARALFEAIGRVVELDERLLDAVTGLSGSGPAYVLLFIEALSDGGVRAGLPREESLLLATQTVLGTAQLLLTSGEHPARLRDQVTSPGGTTIAGLAELERGAVRHAVMAAVEAAVGRARELGRNG